MRTAAILGLGLALAACDRGGGDSASGKNEPAGEVLAAEGEVTAVRAGGDASERELAAGDPIFADDTVETGAGASVRIRLAHNGAIWELNEEARREVRESVAWDAPKASDSEDPLANREEDESLAAGRRAEDEAADTRNTAMPAEKEPEPDSETAKPRTGSADKGAPGEDRRAKRRRAEREKRRAERRKRRSGKDRRSPADEGRGGSEERDIDDALEQAFGGDSESSPSSGAAPEDGAESKRDARRRAASLIKRCFRRHEEAPEGSVRGTLVLDEDGKLEKLELEPSSEGLAAVERCARKRLRGADFGERAAGEIRLELELRR